MKTSSENTVSQSEPNRKPPVCKHVWDRDYIDLTPDQSMPVWSCRRCHDICLENPNRK